jgi:hypothetical protein
MVCTECCEEEEDGERVIRARYSTVEKVSGKPNLLDDWGSLGDIT